MLKTLAIDMSKIAKDMRFLSSGPRGGLNEIDLPQMQPGSSIMPGKVNPVIPELINQISYIVIGNDLTITLAAEAGQLELNVMVPAIAVRIIDSFELLNSGIRVWVDKCIKGITANEKECQKHLENSAALATALSKKIGYEKAAELAKKAVKTGKSFKEVVLKAGVVSDENFDKLVA